MAGSGKIICVKKKSSDLSQRSFQMFFPACLFPALLFLTPSPAEGIVGGVKAQIGQFPYIVSVNSWVCVCDSYHINCVEVSVLHGEGHACGGALISDRFCILSGCHFHCWSMLVLKYVIWEPICSPLLPRCALTSAECCEMVPTNEVRLGLILKLVHHVWMWGVDRTAFSFID